MARVKVERWKPTHRHLRGQEFAFLGRARTMGNNLAVAIIQDAAGQIWVLSEEDLKLQFRALDGWTDPRELGRVIDA